VLAGRQGSGEGAGLGPADFEEPPDGHGLLGDLGSE